MAGNICPHCSGVPTSHRMDYLTALVDSFFERYLGFLENLRLGLRPVFVRQEVQNWLFKTLRWRKLEEYDNNRQKILAQTALIRGIDLYRFFVFGKPTEIFAAKKGERARIFFTLPRPLTVASESFGWLDDKILVKNNFSSKKFPIARGGVVKTKKEAMELFESLGGTVIVKPNHSSRGRHVFTHISKREDLAKAFEIAKQICPWVIIEEHLPGTVHRITLIDNKIAAAIKKDYPSVRGDGQSTIKELVRRENARQERQGPIFYPIKIDEYTDRELDRQNLSWESVPEEGREVVLYNKPGRQLGSTNADVTEDLHPDNAALFARIGEWLNEPLVGIDFMAEDITKSWQEQKCGVIECNTLPFIDIHHHPYRGKPRDVTGKLWDLVFEL